MTGAIQRQMKGGELPEGGCVFVFLEPLGNEKTSNGGGNFPCPLLQDLLGDHL